MLLESNVGRENDPDRPRSAYGDSQTVTSIERHRGQDYRSDYRRADRARERPASSVERDTIRPYNSEHGVMNQDRLASTDKTHRIVHAASENTQVKPNVSSNGVDSFSEHTTLRRHRNNTRDSRSLSNTASHQDLSGISKAISDSKLDLYETPDKKHSKRVIGYQAIYEGEDQKITLAQPDDIEIGDVVEIQETALTSDRKAHLGNGKTIASSAGLQSSKKMRIVVTGGTGELRNGFRITSCNDNFVEKVKNMGPSALTRFFLIEVYGRQTPPNPLGLPTLRIESRAQWLEVSAADTENIVSFRPYIGMRNLGNAEISDVVTAVLVKSQRDIMGVTTLAQAFQGTHPYGPFPRRNALPTPTVDHATPSTVSQTQTQSQTITSASNPPTAPRAPVRRSGRLAGRGPDNAGGHNAGHQQGAMDPTLRPAPQVRTHELPPRPSNIPYQEPTQSAGDKRKRDDSVNDFQERAPDPSSSPSNSPQ